MPRLSVQSALACSTADALWQRQTSHGQRRRFARAQRVLDRTDALDEHRRRREIVVSKCIGELQIGVRRQIEQPLEPQVRQRTIDALANQHRLLRVARDARAQDLELRLRAGVQASLHLTERRTRLFQCCARDLDQADR